MRPGIVVAECACRELRTQGCPSRLWSSLYLWTSCRRRRCLRRSSLMISPPGKAALPLPAPPWLRCCSRCTEVMPRPLPATLSPRPASAFNGWSRFLKSESNSAAIFMPSLAGSCDHFAVALLRFTAATSRRFAFSLIEAISALREIGAVQLLLSPFLILSDPRIVFGLNGLGLLTFTAERLLCCASASICAVSSALRCMRSEDSRAAPASIIPGALLYEARALGLVSRRRPDSRCCSVSSLDFCAQIVDLFRCLALDPAKSGDLVRCGFVGDAGDFRRGLTPLFGDFAVSFTHNCGALLSVCQSRATMLRPHPRSQNRERSRCDLRLRGEPLRCPSVQWLLQRVAIFSTSRRCSSSRLISSLWNLARTSSTARAEAEPLFFKSSIAKASCA